MSDYTYFSAANGAFIEAHQRGRKDETPEGWLEVEGLWPSCWLVDGVPVAPQEWSLGIDGRTLTGIPAGSTVTVGIVPYASDGPTFDLPSDEAFVFVEIVSPGYVIKRVTVR